MTGLEPQKREPKSEKAGEFTHIQELIGMAYGMQEDYEKTFIKGQKVSSRRLRKKIQDMKTFLQKFREDVLIRRKS